MFLYCFQAYIEGVTSPPLINPNKPGIKSSRKQTLKTDNLQEDAAVHLLSPCIFTDFLEGYFS